MRTIILFFMFCLAVLGANAQDEQGIYFAKKTYTETPLLTFQEIKGQLPQPVYDENPLWIETWWKAWELAFKHYQQPVKGSGFVSPWFDAAFSNCIYLWDGSFITMFTNYAYPMVDGIAGLDNFYAKQYPSGEICREINRDTGLDVWANKDDRPLYSSWGLEAGGAMQYTGRDVPSPNPKTSLDGINHPILAWVEWESYKVTGNKERLNLIWEPLVMYYQALQKYIRQGNGLYMTDWASMDNSARNPCIKGGGAAIDISSEMALFAENLADMAKVLGKKDRYAFYKKEAENLAKIINQKMWNDKSGFYFDLNLQEEQCAIKTVAGFWTLIAQVATPQQAKALSLQLQNPQTFGREYPVPTLAADEEAYVHLGDYWCGAVWAPTNTMVIRGLEKYGYDDLAHSIAMKHIEQVAGVYKQTGTIWENYSADSLSQGFFANGGQVKKDFVGWSGIGPIMYLLEYAIGLKPDASKNTLGWNIRSNKPVGCRNYRFNGHTVSLITKTDTANRPVIVVDSDGAFTLSVQYNNRILVKKIKQGHQEIRLNK
ncbi:glycoside hydrolase [Bacteroidia bacterium]|nr:glycoside hydrolase [Bacteroidia bacterium]